MNSSLPTDKIPGGIMVKSRNVIQVLGMIAASCFFAACVSSRPIHAQTLTCHNCPEINKLGELASHLTFNPEATGADYKTGAKLAEKTNDRLETFMERLSQVKKKSHAEYKQLLSSADVQNEFKAFIDTAAQVLPFDQGTQSAALIEAALYNNPSLWTTYNSEMRSIKSSCNKSFLMTSVKNYHKCSTQDCDDAVDFNYAGCMSRKSGGK